MKKFWYLASTTALKEKSESGFHFKADGETILIKDGAGDFHPVTLTEIAKCGTKMAQIAVSSIHAALPKEHHQLYESFDYHRLTDNLACWDSLFLQEPNATYLEPMRRAIEKSVMTSLLKDNGRLHAKKALAWVAEEDNIMSACLGTIIVLSPMPPRDFQIKGFSHEGVESEARPRNLIILDGEICLANPPMKGPNGKRRRAEALWAMAQIICKPFAFNMGVLRPVFTHVLMQLDRDTSLRNRHIFVHSIALGRRKDPGLFTGPDVNKLLQAFTTNLPVKLTVRMLRHLSVVMFQQHYPQLAEGVASKGESLVDALGQHKRVTADTHYSQVQTQSTQLGMLLSRARHYLELCAVYQSSFGLSAISIRASHSVDESLIFSSRKFEAIAFKQAQMLVCSSYRLGGADGASMTKISQDLLTSQPYMVRDDYNMHVTRLIEA